MEHVHVAGSCKHCGLVPIAAMSRADTRVVCESSAMHDVFRRTARFAAADAPVVVLGESGTGKEVVARVLHANGPRASKPFVAINVAALPAELLESELFGHAKGAFTGAHRAKAGLFESAEGGTLFLDEVGEMPLALQAKLLRALADGEVRRVGDNRSFSVDSRIVCATHRDLGELVRTGAFREDLFYRLKVLTLRVPALRDRAEDVLPLARHFLASEKTTARRFAPDAEKALQRHAWPGNVRELQNAVKHGAALATGDAIELDALPEEVVHPRASADGARSPARLRPLAEVEREHVLAVLEACAGSVGDAARILEIGRNTLWRKLKQWS
ncbi:MAG: sigma-54 dependent transcriptional regulator [Myxococcota bacterium]|nr:sigma-54 dependent transcriptional regulator [Myxococcota bacterium]